MKQFEVRQPMYSPDDVNSPVVPGGGEEWPEGDLPEQMGGPRTLLMPGQSTFKLPENLAQLWHDVAIEDTRFYEHGALVESIRVVIEPGIQSCTLTGLGDDDVVELIGAQTFQDLSEEVDGRREQNRLGGAVHVDAERENGVGHETSP